MPSLLGLGFILWQYRCIAFTSEKTAQHSSSRKQAMDQSISVLHFCVCLIGLWKHVTLCLWENKKESNSKEIYLLIMLRSHLNPSLAQDLQEWSELLALLAFCQWHRLLHTRIRHDSATLEAAGHSRSIAFFKIGICSQEEQCVLLHTCPGESVKRYQHLLSNWVQFHSYRSYAI